MNKYIKLLLIAGFGGLILYVVFNIFQPQERTIPKSLKEAVEKALIGTKGTYGIAIKNPKTGESYYLNEHKVFETGSLYKVWILATAFDQIEKGDLAEDEILSQDISILNEKFDISSESAELKEGQITLAVKDALEQMIVVSHNYAALLLSERLKLSTVRAFLKEHNFNESTLGQPPQTTPYDIMLFLEKLYQGELVNNENTKKVLAILKKQKLNEGLPKYLPQDIKIAHKTGDISWFKHDGGIVFFDKGAYIIVVLSESNSPSGAQERIAEVSKAVFEYFKNKNG